MSSERIDYGEITGDWSDDVVYVIGGGPSLSGFPFELLDGYSVGANKSAIIANCDALFTMDRNYANRAREEIVQFPGEKILGLRHLGGHILIEDALYVQNDHRENLSTNPGLVRGLNSGYGALNVAFLKNAKHIRLLGFDMKMDKQKHFHSGYDWDRNPGNYVSWAKRFAGAKKQLDEAGVEVINYVGPEGSAIKCFPTRPLEELYG